MQLAFISGGFRGGRAGSVPPPPGRQTDTVTVLPISENGSVLWRHHRQLTYEQVIYSSIIISLFTRSHKAEMV